MEAALLRRYYASMGKAKGLVARGAVCAGLLVGSLFATPEAAADNRFGIRGGLTDDPDSIFIGIQTQIGGIAGNRNLLLEPALDLGFGDEGPFDYVTLRGTVHLKYLIPVGGGALAYPLGGVSLYYLNIDDCQGDCDDTDISINLGGGMQFGRFAVDLFIGVENPDITLLAAFTL